MRLADLWMSDSTSQALVILLVGVLAISVLLIAGLLSRINLRKSAKLVLVILCMAMAAACFLYAQILLLAWVFPIWFVFSFYRDPTA